MQPLRFNPFGQIHKGLRALLYDTALQLQHTDFSVEEEAFPVLERVRLVITLFEHHADIEDTAVFPMIEDFAPTVVKDFEAQHQTDHTLSLNLERSMARFAETNTAEQNKQAGVELLLRFNAFLAFNVEHMNKEEITVNGCLWQQYSDDQLRKKVQEISASIPPEQNKQFIYWMLKGMATQEIIDWYNLVKLSAPSPVFALYCDLAEAALPESNWNCIKEALQEGALLA